MGFVVDRIQKGGGYTVAILAYNNNTIILKNNGKFKYKQSWATEAMKR
jgi:hypothetical protein